MKKHKVNGSGYEASGYRVLVKPDSVQPNKGSLIHVPEAALRSEAQHTPKGVIVSIGPTAWLRHEGQPAWAEIGQKVICATNSGTLFTGDDEQLYKLINDEDILGTATE